MSLGTASPTLETYEDLNHAAEVFNRELFEGALPQVLITLRATGKTRGYFCPERFVHAADGRFTSEIALNPETFGTRTPEQVLSTLVHEQCHLWQFSTNAAPKRGYHDKVFAARMEALGLPVSQTGAPGGKQTGYRMTHWIAVDGPFQRACERFLDSGFRARWAERFVDAYIEPIDDPDDDIDGHTSPITLATSHTPTGALGAEPATGIQVFVGRAPPAIKARPDLFRPKARSNKTKAKYQCSGCHASVWGKPGLELSCIPCGLPLADTASG